MKTGIILHCFFFLPQVGLSPTIQLHCEKGLFNDHKPRGGYHLFHINCQNNALIFPFQKYYMCVRENLGNTEDYKESPHNLILPQKNITKTL